MERINNRTEQMIQRKQAEKEAQVLQHLSHHDILLNNTKLASTDKKASNIQTGIDPESQDLAQRLHNNLKQSPAPVKTLHENKKIVQSDQYQYTQQARSFGHRTINQRVPMDEIVITTKPLESHEQHFHHLGSTHHLSGSLPQTYTNQQAELYSWIDQEEPEENKSSLILDGNWMDSELQQTGEYEVSANQENRYSYENDETVVGLSDTLYTFNIQTDSKATTNSPPPPFTQYQKGQPAPSAPVSRTTRNLYTHIPDPQPEKSSDWATQREQWIRNMPSKLTQKKPGFERPGSILRRDSDGKYRVALPNPVPTTAPPTTTTTNKETCPHCKGAGYRRANVQFGHPDFGKAIACSCIEAERTERRRQQLRLMSNLDYHLNQRFDTFQHVPGMADARNAAIDFAANPNGWLVLVGPNGCGKTHLAMAIAHDALEKGMAVLVGAVPDLLDHLRAAFDPKKKEHEDSYDQLFTKMREAGLLILDDLGAHHSSPWATEKLFQLLNHRYNLGLPTVITANPNGIKDIDERLRSRLSDKGLVTYIKIDRAQDFRPKKIKPHH